VFVVKFKFKIQQYQTDTVEQTVNVIIELKKTYLEYEQDIHTFL